MVVWLLLALELASEPVVFDLPENVEADFDVGLLGDELALTVEPVFLIFTVADEEVATVPPSGPFFGFVR
jgi:hypothetical protein